jgi:hypothetical protein
MSADATFGISHRAILDLHQLSEQPEVVVYLSGSQLDGFANRTSDIDVFVATPSLPLEKLECYRQRGTSVFYPCTHSEGQHTLIGSPFCIVSEYCSQRRVDYEYWEFPVLERMAEKLRNLAPGDRFLSLHKGEKRFIHRIKMGVPILNVAGFEALRDLYDFARFRRYMVQSSIGQIDNALDDVAGMMDGGDLESALFRVRDVLASAVDAWCCYHDRTNPTAKWRLKVLATLPPDSHSRWISHEFRNLEFPDASRLLADEDACRGYIDDCVQSAGRIVQWIQG